VVVVVIVIVVVVVVVVAAAGAAVAAVLSYWGDRLQILPTLNCWIIPQNVTLLPCL